ncbi:MAG: hypothetical protein Q9165_003498 [Trypethelium subeluteriae]
MLSDSRSSSPDPIALSPTPSPRRRRTRTVNTTPLAEEAANRRRLTPSKTIAFDTPASKGSSPWKIKVTVEAEPHSHDSDAENVSPSQTTRVRSRSTKIPLKDVDGPSPNKPKRGRSQRANSSTTKQRKGNGTPVRKRQSRRQEDGNTENISPDYTSQSPKATPLKSQSKQIKTLSSMLGGDDSDIVEEVVDAPPYSASTMKGQEALTMLVNDPNPSKTNRYPQNSTLTAPVATLSLTPRWQNPPAVPEQSAAEHLSEDICNEPDCTTGADDGGGNVGSDLASSIPGDQTMLQSEGFSFVSVPSIHEIQEHSRSLGHKDEAETHATDGAVEYDTHECEFGISSALTESKHNLFPREALENIPDFSSLLATPSIPKTRTTTPRSDKLDTGYSKTSEVKTSSGMPPSPAVSTLGILPARVTPISTITPPSRPPALPQESPSREEVSTPEITNIIKTGNALQGIVLDLPPLDRSVSTPDWNRMTGSNIKDIPSKPNDRVKLDQGADLSFRLKQGKRLDRFSEAFGSSPEYSATNEVDMASEDSHQQSRHLLTPGDSDDSDVPNQSSLKDAVVYPTLPSSPHDRSTMIPHFQSHDTSLPYSPISDATSPTSEDLDELSRTQQLELEIQQDREAVKRQIEQASTSQVITIDSDIEEDDEEEEVDDNDTEYPFEQDGSGDDESTASQDDGDDTGFFFQRNMPAIFENPRDSRPGNSLYLPRLLKGSRSRCEAEVCKPSGFVSPEVSLDNIYREDSPDETLEESLDNGDVISKEDVFTSSLEQSTEQVYRISSHEIHMVPLNDVARPELRQSNRSHQLFQHPQSSKLDVQNSRCLSTVPESEEDASDPETDLWLPKSDVRSDAEASTTQDEIASSEERPASPCKDAIHLPEASSDINPGLLGRLTAFFRSALTWSAPSQPQIHPQKPTAQPGQSSQQPEQSMLRSEQFALQSEQNLPLAKDITCKEPEQLALQPEQHLPPPHDVTSQETEQIASQLASLQPNVSRREALLHKYGPLSRYEPWSLPHYRTLDRMHHRNLLNPEYFRHFPHNTRTNASTVATEPEPHVLDCSLQELVGHTIQRSGFTVTFSLADIHVIAAFLELLVEPEELSREERDKQATELVPGDMSEDGKVIGPGTVALRLFSVYAGDQMRREERLGLRSPPDRS